MFGAWPWRGRAEESVHVVSGGEVGSHILELVPLGRWPDPPPHTPVKLLPLLFGGPTWDPVFSGLHRTLQVLPEGVLGPHGWDSGQPAGDRGAACGRWAAGPLHSGCALEGRGRRPGPTVPPSEDGARRAATQTGRPWSHGARAPDRDSGHSLGSCTLVGRPIISVPDPNTPRLTSG